MNFLKNLFKKKQMAVPIPGPKKKLAYQKDIAQHSAMKILKANPDHQIFEIPGKTLFYWKNKEAMKGCNLSFGEGAILKVKETESGIICTLMKWE